MERYKKSVFYCALILFSLAILVTFQEGPTLPSEEQPFYYIGRAVMLAIVLCMLPALKKDPFNNKKNLAVAILFALYSIHGQYFNPWYIFSFIQITYAVAILYPMKRWTFIIYTTISTILFCLVLFHRHEIFLRWAQNPVWADIHLAVICASTIALMAHYFFTADRNYREEAIRKFGLIGVQSSALVHDIKGLMSAPKVYSEALIDLLEKYEDPKAKEAVHLLNQSIERFNAILFNLNRMSSLHIREAEEFNFHDVLNEVIAVLRMNQRDIDFEVSVSAKLITEKAHIQSIVFNIVLNSIQSFRRNKTENPRIRIFQDHRNSFAFVDNAGGIAPQLLKNLAAENFSNHTSYGTGLGTYMILDGMKSLGGSAVFENLDDGSKVTLNFPKKSVLV